MHHSKKHTSTAIRQLIEETGIAHENQESVQKSIIALLEGGNRAEKIAFTGFENITTLKRFRGIPMVSHDVVSEHQDRVTRMILFSQHIIHTSTEEFNFQKAVFIAQYHDVSEGISPLGDIPTNVKERLSKQSLQVLEDIELACIDILSSLNYSSFYGEHELVRSMFQDGFRKLSIESWIMKWFDLLDAYMVTIHEILHGNGEVFFPIYRRYLEIMQGILHGTRYKEIGEFLTGINFQSYGEYMQNLFAGEMAEYYMQSTHLFDITMLSKELEKGEDGFYDPPLAYLTWLRFYFPSEYQRNSVIK